MALVIFRAIKTGKKWGKNRCHRQMVKSSSLIIMSLQYEKRDRQIARLADDIEPRNLANRYKKYSDVEGSFSSPGKPGKH
ncbi:hypothetical protein [Herbaspirillum rubrisubalbicans]|uniref:hypothetical protein n=1 Tax=Herbaspirillum rubrisubalbicans TaxID=80842 RepID=UPI0015C5614D|nr:hypothetical protein [Herbaspirillum rubrisubalbicans]